MTDAKTQLELTGLERFSHLEDKIFRVVEAFKTVRKEADTLRSENQQLKVEMEGLRRKQSAYHEELDQLQKEREGLRERVERALELLASLEVK
jgi:FtsZ-binding cell division protein ZapB